MKFASNSIKSKMKAGFSLIELLVVLAIFIIITSVVLARQNRFSSDILLSDLAYQVAISIRQAQVYGLGVRSVGGGGEKGSDITYDTGYGIHFEGPMPASSYIFFPDLNKNKVADVVNGNLETSLSTVGTINYDLSRGQKIVAVCATNSNKTTCLSSGKSGGGGSTINPGSGSSGSDVNPGDGGQSAVLGPGGGGRTGDGDTINQGSSSGGGSLNVIYVRPDPTANITDDQGNFYNTLIITVASSLGDRFKCITAYGTGQVSVSNPTGQGSNPCTSSATKN